MSWYQQVVLETLKEADIFKAMKGQIKMEQVQAMLMGENRVEGLTAFSQKRKPQWKSNL